MVPRKRAEKTSVLNVRVTPDEMVFLTEQADRLGLTISETVRGAIALSYLTAAQSGLTAVVSWINPVTHELLDVEPLDPEALLEAHLQHAADLKARADQAPDAAATGDLTVPS